MIGFLPAGSPIRVPAWPAASAGPIEYIPAGVRSPVRWRAAQRYLWPAERRGRRAGPLAFIWRRTVVQPVAVSGAGGAPNHRRHATTAFFRLDGSPVGPSHARPPTEACGDFAWAGRVRRAPISRAE